MKISDIIDLPVHEVMEQYPLEYWNIHNLPLLEMTTHYSHNYSDSEGKSHIDYLEHNKKYAGDQDKKKIYGIKFLGKNSKEYYTYGIENDEKITAIVTFNIEKILDKEFAKIDTIYCLPEYRKLNDVRRIVFFLKTQENLSLISGGIESNAAVGFIDKIANQTSLQPKWFNIETGEILPYNSNKEQFRNKDEDGTSWLIIIESKKTNYLHEHRYYNPNAKVQIHGCVKFFED